MADTLLPCHKHGRLAFLLPFPLDSRHQVDRLLSSVCKLVGEYITMESLWHAGVQTIESFVDDAAFRLLGIPVPKWYINADIKAAFGERAAWDAVVASSPLSVAAGLDMVLSSTQSPSIDFFMRLPRPSSTRKQWGVYAIVLTKPGAAPKLYIGSGTGTARGVQGRVNGYLNGSGQLSRFVRLAIDQGYKLTSIGLLCWTDAPPPLLVARLRARTLVLEAVFTVVFYAHIKTIMDDVFIPDFFPWQRGDVSWEPACSHLSFSEGLGADLELTEEELNIAAAAHSQRSKELAKRWCERSRQQDKAAFLQQGLDQHIAWGARNPGRINEIAAGVRQTAKDAERFRCETCRYNFATQFALDDYYESRSHIEATKTGGKVLKKLSAATLRKRASRANAKANHLFYCETCKKACSSATDLKRHKNKAMHKKKVAKGKEPAAEA